MSKSEDTTKKPKNGEAVVNSGSSEPTQINNEAKASDPISFKTDTPVTQAKNGPEIEGSLPNKMDVELEGEPEELLDSIKQHRASEEVDIGEDLEEEMIGKKKGPLEYDLQYMYPEMDLLVKMRRKDWDYNDPEIIRAIWLETKTNALAEWKEKHSRMKREKDPTIPVQLNTAVQLQNEFRKMKREREEAEIAALVIGRDAPHFKEITLPTTATVQMRYKINRDDPPIPEAFIHHYAKYKKPPFMKNAVLGRKCNNSGRG